MDIRAEDMDKYADNQKRQQENNQAIAELKKALQEGKSADDISNAKVVNS